MDVGALVGVSGPTKLATIIQTDPLYVYFTLSEPQILSIQRNLAKHGIALRTSNLSDVPVEIGLQGEEGYPHKGHLDYASPQVDFATGTLTARALFDNKDGAILPGLFVRVRTPIGQQDKALLTRNDAIGTSQEGSYVLVVGADNVVRAEGRHDGGARRTAARDRIGLKPRRLGRDRGRSARLSRREGRSAAGPTGFGRARRRHRALRKPRPPRISEMSSEGRAGAISRFFIEQAGARQCAGARHRSHRPGRPR